MIFESMVNLEYKFTLRSFVRDYLDKIQNLVERIV